MTVLYRAYRGGKRCFVERLQIIASTTRAKLTRTYRPQAIPSPLNPRTDLREFSDGFFEWGYNGTGPKQLALALLCDALQDDARAVELVHLFTVQVVAELDGAAWQIEASQIVEIAEAIEAGMKFAEQEENHDA